MINTIIFDMGNVLIDFRWRALYKEMGLEGEEFDKMAGATTLNPFWNEFDRGILSDEEMLEGFIERAPEMESTIRRFFDEEFSGLLRKFDYSAKWLRDFRLKGYKVLILSNFSEKALRECADELDYMKEATGLVISCKVGMIKPNEDIYRYLIDTYDVKPEEAVFIDDTKANIDTAIRLGMKGILFTDKAQADRELEKLGVK